MNTLPESSFVVKNGRYLRIENAHGHPLASRLGRIPYHRLILYEKMNNPEGGKCHWCGYMLPWRTSLSHGQTFVLCADHLDANTENNDPDNLVPACSWCNENRNWAELHPQFWSQWRRWMRDVPPTYRPNLIEIAQELRLTVTDRNLVTVE